MDVAYTFPNATDKTNKKPTIESESMMGRQSRD